jgi:hypothetical protein
LREAGIAPEQIYEDRMSGRHDRRPGLDACLKALRATPCASGSWTAWAATSATSSPWSTRCRSAASACACSPARARPSTRPGPTAG